MLPSHLQSAPAPLPVPGETRKPPDADRRRLTLRLLRRTGRYRGILAVAFVMMLVAGSTEMAPILLAKVFVGQVLLDPGDGAAPRGDRFDLWVAGVARSAADALGVDGAAADPRLVIAGLVAAAMVVLSVLAAVSTYANEFIAKYLASLVVKDLRVDLLARVVRWPCSRFSKRKIGDLVSRFSNDTTTAFQTINIFISEILLQPFILVFTAAGAILLNWRLALASLLTFPIVVWPVLRLGRRVHVRSRKTLVSLGETMESVGQTLSGLRVVKAFRMEDEEVRDFERVNDDWLRRQVSLVKAKALGRSVMDLVWGFVLAILLLGGSWLVVTGTWGLTPADFVGFLVAIVSVYRPLKRLSVAYNTWQASLAAAARVFEVLDTAGEPADPPDAVRIGPIRQGIVFDDVGFAYADPEDPSSPDVPVLDGFRLTIPARSTIALVGPSGAGKTTVADLLLRFHEPGRGRILVDGIPLRRVSRESLLAQVALVGQHPFLFNTTVRENIAYGRPGATRDEIEAAAQAACIHDEILRLPHGYDTVVGERGASLSGGQLQRITIARAILKDASLLVLDEATSSLDGRSERAVQTALENLLRGRTALVIAHRLSTVARADRICVMEDGRIVEEGSHDGLLARGGTYHRLYAVQVGDAGGSA